MPHAQGFAVFRRREGRCESFQGGLPGVQGGTGHGCSTSGGNACAACAAARQATRLVEQLSVEPAQAIHVHRVAHQDFKGVLSVSM